MSLEEDPSYLGKRENIHFDLIKRSRELCPSSENDRRFLLLRKIDYYSRQIILRFSQLAYSICK